MQKIQGWQMDIQGVEQCLQLSLQFLPLALPGAQQFPRRARVSMERNTTTNARRTLALHRWLRSPGQISHGPPRLKIAAIHSDCPSGSEQH